MESIEEAMKRLRRTIRKTDGAAESLELISKIEQEALVCKGMVPSRTATLPEGERTKFLTPTARTWPASSPRCCKWSRR